MKRYILPLIFLMLHYVAFSQDFYDALKYSQTEYGGTARSIAMGSAFGALGGDFASASINPAGLSLYRSSEIAFSPVIQMKQSEADYLNNTESKHKYSFMTNNISFVGTFNTKSEKGINNVVFGLGVNKIKSFNSKSYIQGSDAQSTLLNYYTDFANQIVNHEDFSFHYEGLPWNTWLIDKDTDPDLVDGIYFNDLTDYSDRIERNDENGNFIGYGYDATGIKKHQQLKSVDKSGYINDYTMAMAFSIGHKLHFGGSLNLSSLYYYENSFYTEYDNNKLSDFLSEYSINTITKESGLGVNFKAGVLYRPFKALRLGLSIHTPTIYDISKTEEKIIDAYYDQEIGNETDGYRTSFYNSNKVYYSYSLETPLRINLSTALSFGNFGVISVDYERINYKTMQIEDLSTNNSDYLKRKSELRNDFNSPNYSAENDIEYYHSEIKNVFNSTGNLRIGAEANLSGNVSLRAGYQLIGNPWKSSYTYSSNTAVIENYNDTFAAYSGGIGYRNNNLSIDFAYKIHQSKYSYKVHNIYYTNPNGKNAIATISELDHQATITLGLRF